MPKNVLARIEANVLSAETDLDVRMSRVCRIMEAQKLLTSMGVASSLELALEAALWRLEEASERLDVSTQELMAHWDE